MPAPTYALEGGDVVEIVALGRLFDQRTRTTFHYRWDGVDADDGRAKLDELLTQWDTIIWAAFLDHVSEDWKYEFSTIQKVLPTRYRALVHPHSTTGNVLVGSLPPTTCTVIRREGIASGRRYQGRIFLPGVPSEVQDGGKLKADEVTALNLIKDNLQTYVPDLTVTGVLVPIIHYKGALSGLDDVAVTVVDNVLRVQRRREVGVGE